MENFNYLENLPYELKENIFKNLNLNDFLTLTLVSKSLNEAVGHSNCCMSKIWIKFYSFKLKDLSSLKNSMRSYEKLKINRVKSDEHFTFIAGLKQNFKKVLIYNCEFKCFSLFYDLIESFAETIEELEISDVEILSYNREATPLKFPSLKRFMFRNLPLYAIKIFTLSSKKLKNASFDIPQGFDQSHALQKITCEILKASPKLKLLQLGPQYIKEVFLEEKNFDFKLNYLLLKFPIVSDLSESEIEIISRFLSTQTNLKWLALMELQNDEILKCAWNLGLTRVSLIGLEELMKFEIETESSTITHIDIFARKVLISQLRMLIKAAPRVTTIHVKLLNEHMFNFLAKNSSIQTLFYENAEESALNSYEEYKNQLKLIKSSFWFNNENPFSLDPIFWRN